MYDRERLIGNPRTNALGGADLREIGAAERVLGCAIPAPVAQWIRDFGTLDIARPGKNDPHLLLLGLGPATSMDDNVMYFNHQNPSLPQGFFAFAHEFDGEWDSVYAMDQAGRIHRTRMFAFPYLDDRETYRGAEWVRVYDSMDEFWEKKVRAYLDD